MKIYRLGLSCSDVVQLRRVKAAALYSHRYCAVQCLGSCGDWLSWYTYLPTYLFSVPDKAQPLPSFTNNATTTGLSQHGTPHRHGKIYPGFLDEAHSCFSHLTPPCNKS